MKRLRACGALITGGGPAGSMLAIALAGAGRDVVLIEKTREAQHKVCGEFLSPESVPFLRRVGIAFWMSQTMVLTKQLSVVKTP